MKKILILSLYLFNISSTAAMTTKVSPLDNAILQIKQWEAKSQEVELVGLCSIDWENAHKQLC